MHSDLESSIVTCEGNTFVISAALSGGRVAEAWSTGRMIQDMNYLLGATFGAHGPQFTTRASCLCNAGHALAAVRAVEDLFGLSVPPAARLVRNLTQGLQWVSEHLGHFYLFHLSDWLNLGLALRADPGKSARLDRDDSPRPEAGGEQFYRDAVARLKTLAEGESGAFFAVGDYGHPAYAASPECSLLAFSHVPQAMRVRADLAEALAVLRCTGAEHPAFQVGGLAGSAGTSPGGAPDLSPAARARCAALVRQCRDFILHAFLPDILRVADAYRGWADIGRTGVFLAFTDLPGEDGQPPFYPGGICTPGGILQAPPASLGMAWEDGETAWNGVDADHYRLRFGPGQPVYRFQSEDFVWFGAPRNAGLACEVGPLARICGAYAAGNGVVQAVVDDALGRLNLPLAALNSTLGRMLARGLEAAALIQAALSWLDSLDRCLAREGAALRADVRDLPASGEGTGLAEIARGSLAHRIRMEDRRIVRHESLVPSLWNFSTRSPDGTRGPLEQALLATPVADAARPLEILRTIHAFDPCNACILRVEDAGAGRVVTVNAK
ncbi:nickel-dependent hydrogenase large subunit [Desulfolutivibrio sp.]|uniref:nickel-dependent hydrogenase large subunit n=1 Tax=Desulfolutivibrio sp. TaxID=2773296 RepID=UPI002F960A41